VSINDAGKTAFIGDVSGGQGIFVADGSSLTDISPAFVQSSRTYDRGLQINNNQVAIEDTLSGPNVFRKARIWDGNQIGSFTTIATGISNTWPLS
jgi:hypothetical protein